MDQARQTADAIERERLMQAAEHYGRIVAAEQGKIDSQRAPGDKGATTAIANPDNATDDASDEEDGFADFVTNLK
ncbi:hypothetical protein HDR63_00005 [bacterium]|nr:hypothetical protein [bacterium]